MLSIVETKEEKLDGSHNLQQVFLHSYSLKSVCFGC